MAFEPRSTFPPPELPVPIADYDVRRAVAGVAGGVGTSTLAAAMGARDRGVFVGRPVDVLVCRATGDSLIRAGHAAQLIAQTTGRKPVVAVTSADASGPSRPVTARLRLLEPHTAAVIVLPFIRRWRDLSAPLEEARALFAVPRTDLPRSQRRYASAIQSVVSAVGGHAGTTLSPPAWRPMSRHILGRMR